MGPEHTHLYYTSGGTLHCPVKCFFFVGSYFMSLIMLADKSTLQRENYLFVGRHLHILITEN